MSNSRQARELRALQPFAWDKRIDKHPPNIAKFGMLLPRAPRCDPKVPNPPQPKIPSDAEHSDSDTEVRHNDGGLPAASGSRETSPSMRQLVEQAARQAPGPAPTAAGSVEERLRILVGAAVDATVSNGGGSRPSSAPAGAAKRRHDDASGSNGGERKKAKKSKKDEKKKERGRKGDPKQLPPSPFPFPGSARPAAPVSPPAAGSGDLYALLRQSNGPPAPQEAQPPAPAAAAAPAPAPAAAPAPAPSAPAPPAAAPAPAPAPAAEPLSVQELLVLLKPLRDSGRCAGGLRGSYVSCYSRMNAADRVEQSGVLRSFLDEDDLEEMESFMRTMVNPPQQ